MTNLLNDVIDNFTLRLKEEQCRRDAEVWKGSFVESSVIEHLYRYWFESILVLYGCDEIQRETPYSEEKSGNGRKPACDVTATYENKEYWFELKVAYWNTTYTPDELMSDIDKLYKAPKNAIKVYVVVFIGKEGEIPQKMEEIISQNTHRFNAQHLAKVPMLAPDDWEMKDVHCHVGLFELKAA